MSKKISIKTIAQKAGVSTTAVSFVLNDKCKEGRISKELAQRIREIAEDLNYIPNKAAQSLRTGRTHTIGLIVADISNPFFSKLARVIENAAAEKGYQVMFGSSDESFEKFSRLVNLFIEKNVDGVIVAPPEDSEEAIIRLIKNDIPTVLIDRGIDELEVSSVQIDNIDACYKLTKRLIADNCKRIGFLAYNIKLPNLKQRYEGYLKALNENGMPIDENIVQSVSYDNFEDNINNALSELLKKKVDSVVFATNRVGIQSLIFYSTLKEQRIIKFASVDNPDAYKLSNIPIYCIEQPIEELGRNSLDILLRKFKAPKTAVVERIVLNVFEVT